MIDRRTLLALGITLVPTLVAPVRVLATGAAANGSGPAHRFAFDGLDGGTLRLSEHAGRLVLVVNTASECAYTPQYRDLQALHEAYGGRGLSVIGVPADDFGGQTPGGALEIREVCSGDYGVTFPMAAKTRVVGTEAHPFYRWAFDELGPKEAPRWNFHKYVVSPDGRLIRAFPSSMNPRDPRIVAVIEANLPK